MFRFLLVLALAAAAMAQSPFFLKSGDRVVFYGDSITDQRLYTVYTETFVRTRFPGLDVRFVHSGWGGDSVYGGAGGPIDLRLRRDVAAYRPNVVTIMLGMNDGRYRPLDPGIFDQYRIGYASLVRRLQTLLPGVRIVAIRPSPFDEVTRPPLEGGGYNPVLVGFGQYLEEFAAKTGLSTADLNAPVVRMLERASAANPELAKRIIQDRVHPGPAGQLVMAAALLTAWGAPGLVSDVEIDAPAGRVLRQEGTGVQGLQSSTSLQWTQADRCLPMPVDLNDPVMALAVASSDFSSLLNREMLKVAGLPPGHFALRIDGLQVKVFTSQELAAGVNLSEWPTPMTRQAADVHTLTQKRTDVHQARWRVVEVPLAKDGLAARQASLAALDRLDQELEQRQAKAAQPAPHRFEIVRVRAEAASVPPGFTPLFNDEDLAGWHISRTNHHGATPDWRVEDGVLTGSQNPPGKGGILLTDRKYRNFILYLEVKPDWGCDGGIFLRSSEAGEAYQVMLDYREGGTLFGIYGERLRDVPTFHVPDWRRYWREGDWNALRIRVDGDAPRIGVTVNGVPVTAWSDTANHAAGGAVDGMIAVQVHGGSKIWKEGGRHRFRNIAIRELPD